MPQRFAQLSHHRNQAFHLSVLTAGTFVADLNKCLVPLTPRLCHVPRERRLCSAGRSGNRGRHRAWRESGCAKSERHKMGRAQKVSATNGTVAIIKPTLMARFCETYMRLENPGFPSQATQPPQHPIVTVPFVSGTVSSNNRIFGSEYLQRRCLTSP